MHAHRPVRRLALLSTVIGALVLALSVPPVGAATNLVGNGGFEVPRVPTNSFGTFGVGSTLGTCGLAMPGSPGYQFHCWRVFAGDVDVVDNGFWDAKSGKQSLELNGNGPGSVLQLYAAQPNRSYKMKFALAGDPIVAGTVTLLAVQEQFDSNGNYISGAPIGTYTFDTTGHSGTAMGYVAKTGFFTTGSTTKYVDVELQSLTQNNDALWWGPVVDNVVVSDHGPARG